MAGDRLLRILSHFKPEDSPRQICQRSADIMGVSGAGIALMQSDVTPCAISDAFQIGVRVADLEYILGEGPCRDAFSTRHLIGDANLRAPDTPRWSVFPSEAVAMGVGAVFAFPMQMGTIRLGSIYFYRTEPGGLTDDQTADGFCLARSAARGILGIPIAEIIAGRQRYGAVHQAAGIVSVQLGVSVTEGLVRLRARAFVLHQPLHEVASLVVTHQIRITSEE
jgi:hypothetical protein